MAWRDQLGRVTLADGRQLVGAQFREAVFFVEAAELAGGRRVVAHEFPQRDVPWVEDLGRKARTWPVEGYVLGDGYLALRDALLAALEAEGPGELAHPHYGRRRVSVGDYRVRETTSEGGIARFAITFLETEVAPPFPSIAPAAAEAVRDDAEAIVAAIKERQLQEYLADQQPLHDLTSLEEMLVSASRAMDAALSPLVSATADLAALRRSLSVLEQADAIVRSPADVADAFLGVVESFGTVTVPGVQGLLAAYRFADGLVAPPTTTTTRQQELANWTVLRWFGRCSLLARAARLAADVVFETYDAAVALRGDLLERLDEVSEEADDATLALLQQLRVDLVRAVPGEDRDLPRLLSYTPAVTQPSLVLAHRLYGAEGLAEREADLVVRNGILRPGFVTGGEPLEVLSDG